MNKNYKSALEKIKATDDFKNKMIKELSAKTNQKRETFVTKHKFISGLAASLAVVIAAGALFTSGMLSKQDFILTANAAVIDQLSLKDNKIDDWFYYTDKNNKLATLSYFPLNIEQRGKKIDTITYKAKSQNKEYNVDANIFILDSSKINTSVYSGDAKSIIGKVPKLLLELMNENKSLFNSKNNTVSYKHLTNSIPVISLVCNDDMDDCYPTDAIDVCDAYEVESVVTNLDFENAYKALISNVFKDIVITVTVKYEDGTKLSQDIGMNALDIVKKNDIMSYKATPDETDNKIICGPFLYTINR